MISTPLERDPKFGTRAVLNDEEYAQRLAQMKARTNFETPLVNPNARAPLAAGWFDYGKPNRQAA